MHRYLHHRRTTVAIACLLAFACGIVPVQAFAAFATPSFDDLQSQRALALLNHQSCAVALAQPTSGPTIAPSATPPASPAPSATPSLPPLPQAPTGQQTLYATPFPTSSPVGPPPVPTASPNPSATHGPVFLQRTNASAPPTVAPAGVATPGPSPTPTGVPTLRPGYIAVLADKVAGSGKPGKPGDATGNVHIFYQNAVLVGERAHYDGVRTITVSGNPYIINNEQNSIYYADTIAFDTIDQKAELINGRGESSQGVEQGLVYFSSPDLKTEADGVSHGDRPYVTTCARPRSGYHITGRTVDVKPGDRITITKAVLWLGAAAVFYLPKVVIPLRSVSDERQKPQFFPEIGYDSYQGYYVKARLSFGHDQYYYGYYRVEFFSKVGLGLGYVGFLQRKDGKRQTSINYYGIHDRRVGSSNYNLDTLDTENFSKTLRGQFGLAYNSNYGPLTNVPPNTRINGTVYHTAPRNSQTYSFSRSEIGSQSKSDGFGFTDTHTITPTLSNSVNFTLTSSQSSYGGFFSSNSSSHFTDLAHWASRGADYQLTIDKSFAKSPFGIEDKLPELQIRPNSFFQHFAFPLGALFTIGKYSEPQNSFATSRADLSLNLGPALYHFYNSDFSATVNVDQYAYGTGDLKAKITQQASLSTVAGRHIVNSLTYTESNYNGPAFVPFQNIDQQPLNNYHTAQDVMRFFNSDYYNLSLGFGTNFDRMAQPVSYQLTTRPSSRSYASIAGSFVPGSGNGFYSTNFQIATPFGRGGTLQFLGDVDWKNRARIENKQLYYSRIIGDCYELAVSYNQSLKQINLTVNILAFPSHSANLGISTQGGPIFQNGLNSF
ncbi:MAG TPA: hypothetical protein VIG32_06290 [Candidatus Baltobacteraceae bacterium]